MNFVNKKKKKIAYSTSFGHSESFFPENEKAEVSRLLHEFDSLSVREADGVDICRDDFHVKAELMVDPVFLCDKKIYDSVALEVDSFSNKSYIFAYILDPTDEKREALISLSKKMNLDYIVLLDGQAKDKEQKKQIMGDENVVLQVEIEQWLRLVMDAQFIFTDSFHGTCFAIIYHKNFCTIKNDKRGNSRFHSLMQMTGLEDHLIEEQYILKDLTILLEKEDINYEIVDALIKRECRIGMEWLKTAVNREQKSISEEDLINNRLEKLERRMTELEHDVNVLKSQEKEIVVEEKEEISLLTKFKNKVKGITGGEKNA